MQDIIDSPIFTASKFDSGTLQFEDAMLHAEFPAAPPGWHLIFTPTVAPTIDVTAPSGTVSVYQSKSGRYLGVVNDPKVFAKPISKALRTQFSAGTYVVFVSYNSLFAGAFGFHSAYMNKAGTALTVFTYTSWLEQVNDLFSLPSPNADTFAHEISESTHDPFITSKTLEWGDWFRNNHCFQPYIEVGDAVEDAPAKVQNYKQTVMVHGKPRIYTLQTEAELPWFTREYPSSALHGRIVFLVRMCCWGRRRTPATNTDTARLGERAAPPRPRFTQRTDGGARRQRRLHPGAALEGHVTLCFGEVQNSAFSGFGPTGDRAGAIEAMVPVAVVPSGEKVSTILVVK